MSYIPFFHYFDVMNSIIQCCIFPYSTIKYHQETEPCHISANLKCKHTHFLDYFMTCIMYSGTIQYQEDIRSLVCIYIYIYFSCYWGVVGKNTTHSYNVYIYVTSDLYGIPWCYYTKMISWMGLLWRSLVDSTHKGPLMQSFDIFFVYSTNELLNKQSYCQ